MVVILKTEKDMKFAKKAFEKKNLLSGCICRRVGSSHHAVCGGHIVKSVSLLLVIGLFAFAQAADPNVWWVSRNGGDDVNGAGTDASPFESIQRAVNAASAGDTINIRAGVYDQGEYFDGSQTNRVLIDKKLTLVGVDGKDVTHVVGRYQLGATDDKTRMGAAAIRCIRIKNSSAAGTVIKNLTIRDGAAQNGSDAVQSWGGGVCGYEKGRTAFCLVDCVISNCAACWGGAFHGGVAVRCMLNGNWGVGPGNSVRYGNMVNCLVVNSKNYNTAARSALAFGTFVNCTVASCTGGGIGFSGYVYNSIAFNTKSTEIWAVGSAYTSGDNYVVSNSYKSTNAPYLLFSPATGDYMLTAGTSAVGGGRTEFLSKISLPAGVDPYCDMAGRRIDSACETCDAGCFQGCKTPAAGRIAFSSAYEVEGVSNLFGKATCYYTPETWPETIRVRQLSIAPEKYMCATVEGFHANTFRRIFPLMDGTHLIVPPPFTNETTTLTAKAAGKVVYAAPTGDAETADGTAGNPIPTLQGAVNYAVSQTSEGADIMILAKPGTYDEGGANGVGPVFTRLVLPSTRYWLVKGIEGAANTVIKGHVDEDSSQPNAAYYQGCGSNAVRCVQIVPRTASGKTYPTAVQGFTLTDGRTHCDTTDDNDAHRGAGVIGTSTPNCQLLDCIVTNCWAERCTVSYNAGLFRCKVYDCHGFGGVMRSTRIISSYVDPSCTLGGHPSGVSANCIFGNSTYALLCTAPNVDVWNDNWCFSTLCGKLAPRAALKLWGSACTNAISNASVGYKTFPEINFADPANGDWRLRETSRARYEVQLPEKGTPEYGQWATNFAANVWGDVDGNPISVIGGTPMPGCWHTTVGEKSLFIAADKAGISVTGGTLGDNAAVDGLSVSVSVGSGTRPCIGLLVNGETNLFSDAATYTFTAADVAASEHGIAASAIYSTHWYVNPGAIGDDDLNNGFSRQTPKKTLAGIMSLAASGDTVHAAAGRYDSGEMTDTSGYGSKARAVIKGGVTLVADEGPENSFIMGAPDTVSDQSLLDPYGYGMGSNAVRAVYMENKARLVGFTVTGGRSWYLGQSDWSAPWSGGGIEGQSSYRSTIYVEDSIISNNYAVYGGGVRYVKLIRCRVYENHATVNGGALRDSHAFGTVFNRNYSGTTQTDRASCHEYTGLVGCTLGPDNYNMNGGAAQTVSGASSNQAYFHDNLVLGKTGGKGNLTNKVTGCVFANSCNNLPVDDTCVVVPSAELVVDENLRPIVGQNAAVDIGSPEALVAHTAGLLPLDVDALGFMRVMNGRIDVGALEGDWRPMYAKLLDGKGTCLKVTAVDSGTFTNEVGGVASVELHGGESLALTWGAEDLPATRRGKVLVTGEGTLAMILNGETNAVFTAADGAAEFAIPATGLSTFDFGFAFEGEGTADLYGFSARLGSMFSIR